MQLSERAVEIVDNAVEVIRPGGRELEDHRAKVVAAGTSDQEAKLACGCSAYAEPVVVGTLPAK